MRERRSENGRAGRRLFTRARKCGQNRAFSAARPRRDAAQSRSRRVTPAMPTQHWLVKSEPDVYSWDKFKAEKKAVWDGVRNFTARNNLRAMKKGDLVLFYHSNEGKEVVGIATVATEGGLPPRPERQRG